MANTTIQHKRSLTSGNLPAAASLKQGELAINIPDRRVFTKDQTNTVIDVFGQSVNTTANVSFGSGVFSNGVTTTQYTSNIAVGTAPLVVTSTTVVTNLNTDLLDGQHGSFYTNATNISTGTLGAARLPAFTGDATSSAGSSNLTLASTGVVAGTYGNSSIIPSITVDAKGRVTSVVNTAVAGVSNFSYASSNNTFSIVTGDGSSYNATISQVNNLTITGNLVVSGTTTYINTNQLNIGDNIIALNADLGAVAPTENAGLSVNRGSSANVDFTWNETSDEWTLGNTAVTGYISSTSTVTGTQLVSSVATGTAPFVVASNTVVTNLNADFLDGQTGAYYSNLQNSTNILSLDKGGSNSNLVPVAGGLVYSNTQGLSITVAGTTGQYLISNGTSTPVWKSPADLAVGYAWTVNNGVYTTGSYSDPAWITSLAASKVGLGNVTNESKATMFASPTFTGTANVAGSLNVTGAINRNPVVTTTLTGDLTGSASATLTDLASNTISIATTLASTGVPAGTYGNSSVIPQITVDSKGRITSVANVVTVASGVASYIYTSSNNTFRIESAAGYLYATIDTVNTFSVSNTLSVTGTTTLGAVNVSGNANFDTGTLFVDATNNRVGVGNTTPATSLEVAGNVGIGGRAVMESAAVSTTSTTQTVLTSFSATTYGCAKLLIQATRGGSRDVSEVLVTHDGVTAYATEYGSVRTANAPAIYSLDVDVSGGNVRVLVTSSNTTSTLYKAAYTMLGI